MIGALGMNESVVVAAGAAVAFGAGGVAGIATGVCAVAVGCDFGAMAGALVMASAIFAVWAAGALGRAPSRLDWATRSARLSSSSGIRVVELAGASVALGAACSDFFLGAAPKPAVDMAVL